MGVSYKVGTFTARSSTGTQDITGVGFQPKALIIWSIAHNVLDAYKSSIYYTFGYSDGTNDCSVGYTSGDGIATSATESNVYNDAIIQVLETNGTYYALATLNSFSSDGFQLNWTTNALSGYYFNYIAIGGTDITNVKVGTQSVGTTTTGSKAYTGVGFQPDFLLTGWSGFLPAASAYTYNTTTEAHGGMGVGCAKSSSARWAVTAVSEDARAVADTWRYQRGDKCFAYLDNTTGTLLLEADFTSFDSDGFTWNYSTNTTANNQNASFIYMAIKGGIWDVSYFQSPATNTTVTTNTSASGTLKGVFTADTEQVVITSATIASHSYFVTGGSDGTTNACTAIGDNDAVDPMVAVGILSSSYLIWQFVAAATEASSTLAGRATVSFATSSFTTTWTNTDASQRYIPYWALSQAGGVLNTRDITESSISVSDSNARVLLGIRSQSESSIAVSDSNVRLLSAFRTLSESAIAVSDSNTRIKIAPRTSTESSIVVSDSIARKLTALRTLTDTITVSDTLTRIQTSIRILTESTIAVSDSLAAFGGKLRTISESAIAVSDSVARVAILIRSQSESTIAVSDSLTRLRSVFKTISEGAISISDSLARKLTALRTSAESAISVSDSLVRLLTAIRTRTETTIAVSDTVSRAVPYTRTISEAAISVSDTLTRLVPFSRTLSEASITVSESLSRLTTYLRTLTGPVTVSDSVVGINTPLKSRIITETVLVTEQLNRLLRAFRTLPTEIISVLPGTVDAFIVPPEMAQYITDAGYKNELRLLVKFIDRKISSKIHYEYNSYFPSERPFNLLSCSVRLAQGEIGAFSMEIEDHAGEVDADNIGFNSRVQIYVKKELGAQWVQLMTGYVRRVQKVRSMTDTLIYRINGYGLQVIFNERITNFKRAAKRTQVDSIDPLPTDSSMFANNLFSELITATDILPLRGPSLQQQAGFTLDEISPDVTDFISAVAPGLTDASAVANAFSELTGAIWGVNREGKPFFRYPTQSHSGIIIKDNPQDTDSAHNTSINMGPFDYEDTIDLSEGFANRLYVLNSQDTKSTASSSKATGSTTFTFRGIAQKFIAGDNNISGAAFILSRVGNPVTSSNAVFVKLRGDKNGYPTGPTLATTEIPFSSIDTTKSTVFLNEIKPLEGTIIPGNAYWWFLGTTGIGDDSNTIRWHHDNEQVTINRFSAILPLVDQDPTTPGSQLVWTRSDHGPVYAFSTFSSVRHVLEHSDPESIEKFGLIEGIVDLPAFEDDATFQKALLQILKSSSRPKRIYEHQQVTIPTQRLFFPGELITLVDSKAQLTAQKNVTAEIAEVLYNFNADSNAMGCKYVDIRCISFLDKVLDDFMNAGGVCIED